MTIQEIAQNLPEQVPLFLILGYLFIRSQTSKRQWRALDHAVKWSSKESLRSVDADQIRYLVWHRGPERIWFRAEDAAGQRYDFCLEIRISNVQFVKKIFRNWDANYKTVLISNVPVEAFAE